MRHIPWTPRHAIVLGTTHYFKLPISQRIQFCEIGPGITVTTFVKLLQFALNVLLLTVALTASADCWTTTLTRGARTVTCTTCCVGDSCATTCF